MTISAFAGCNRIGAVLLLCHISKKWMAPNSSGNRKMGGAPLEMRNVTQRRRAVESRGVRGMCRVSSRCVIGICLSDRGLVRPFRALLMGGPGDPGLSLRCALV